MKKYLLIGAALSVMVALIYFAPYKNPMLFGSTGGPNYAATLVDQMDGDAAWVNLANMEAADGSTATGAMIAAGGGTTDTVYLTNFGFSIPAGATIDGITAEINRQKTGIANNVVDFTVRLIKAGTPGGTNKADTTTLYPSSLGVATYGSAADLWGNTLTATDVNASNFGIAYAAQINTGSNNTAGVDYIRITITYTPAANTISSQTVIINASQVITNANTVIQ